MHDGLLAVVAVLAVGMVGCCLQPSSELGPDAGQAGTHGGTLRDGGGGALDSGIPSASDGGIDGGSLVDAGQSGPNSGPDSGPLNDAGTAVDAGAGDGGPQDDGGSVLDSGSPADSGSDAGPGPAYMDLAGWPRWHHDPAATGQSAADTSWLRGAVAWKYSVGQPAANSYPFPTPTYMNSPVVGPDGTIYQLGMDGTLHAVNPVGKELWTAYLLSPVPDVETGTPLVGADGTIYVASGSYSLTANQVGLLFHVSASGQLLYRAQPPAGCRTDPTTGSCIHAQGFQTCPNQGPDGLIYAGSNFGQTVAYADDQTGTLTEQNTIVLPWMGLRTDVVVGPGDTSFWCSSNLCFALTPPTSGFQIASGWPLAGAAIGNAPGAPDGGNATTLTNSDLAYDATGTGWLFVEAGSQTSSTGWTEVVAMDPATGSLHWDVTLPSGPTPGKYVPGTVVGLYASDVGNSAPAVGKNGVVYVGNLDGLYAFDAATGTIEPGFPFKTQSDVDTAPALGGDGTIFFGTANGTLYAVQPDGSGRFQLATAGRISSSPAIGPDGTVYFVSDDGFLYAVH